MKKLIFVLSLSAVLLELFISGVVFPCFAAWDPTRPTNDEYKYIVPSVIRANWDAIAIGTDSALLVTNAKCSPSMGLVDTKLATIATANKVNASAIFSLASTPSDAGQFPIVNIPTITSGKGGTNTDSSASTGMPKVTAGAWTFNATQDDLGDGSTYKKYNPAGVAITGGSISGTTIAIENRTSDPGTPATGQMWIRTDL